MPKKSSAAGWICFGTILAALAVLLTAALRDTYIEQGRERRDIALLEEVCDTIKGLMDTNYVVESEVRRVYRPDGTIDVRLEEILTNESGEYDNLSSYLNSSEGLAVHHSFYPTSRAALHGDVFIRIRGNGTVEALVTDRAGGQPMVCRYVTAPQSYAYTDEDGRRKLFALR